MSKRDKLIAEAIKEQWTANMQASKKKDIEAAWYVHLTALRIAHKLEAENPRFNTDKFLTACGVR